MNSRKTATKRGNTKTSDAPRADVYERVTEKMIEQLEAGKAPWRRPWQIRTAPLGRPFRASGLAYRGINTLLLWMQARRAVMAPITG